jgi:cytochrome c biogenesis protein CcmG/thiol:disulfide interchange protein DsbE
MKRALFLLPVAAFFAVIAAFVLGLRHDPSHITSTLIDKPLPQFALPAVRGNQGQNWGQNRGLSSADFKGEPMLLNVFASWCVSCRLEHGLLLQLKSQGVTIQGLDWKDEAVDAARYLVDNGDPYIKAGNDKSGRTGIDLGVAGVPETFVVDAKGRVRYKIIGPIAVEDWEDTVKPLLQRLRSET